MKNKINRNVSEQLAKDQNDAAESSANKKLKKRAKEKARRLRAERK